MEQVPAIYTDRKRQLRGMISFHKRVEIAYRAVNRVADADRAKQAAGALEKELAELENAKA